MEEKIFEIEFTPYEITNNDSDSSAISSLACGEGGCDSCDGGL